MAAPWLCRHVAVKKEDMSMTGYFRSFRQMFTERVFSSRTYVVAVLQGFMLHLYMRPVAAFSRDMGYAAAPWAFPFILSNIFYLLLFMIGIIYCFSDVPFMQYKNMYQVIRTGRRRWAACQVSAILAQSFLIMAANVFFSMVLLSGSCELTLDWGKLYHTLALTGSPEEYRFLFAFSYETMQMLSPLKLTALTVIIGTLGIGFIGLFMFAVSIYINRSVAVTAAFVMVLMIYLVENIHPLLREKMAMFVPVNWMRVTQIGVKLHDSFIQPPVLYMLMVLAAGIAVCAVLILIKIKKMEFQWYKEE